jgi:hypothetical protein
MNHSFIAWMNSPIQQARPGLDANSEGLFTGPLVDLNRVVQQAFEEQQQRMSQLQTIIRCDTLPLVQGHVPVWLLLFRKLVELVLDHPPRNSKLFIYLKCDKKASDCIDLSLPEGFTHHEIIFYTNSNITPEWEKVYNDTLAKCQQLTHESKGTLSWQTAPGAGCLFRVNLPGKMN